MQLGLGGTAVGTLQRNRTVASGQFGGGAGVTSIGRHSHFVSLTVSSRQSGVGLILALNALDVTLGFGSSRFGQLVVVFRAFSGCDNERNQRARWEAHAGAKSCRCGTWEIVAIGLAVTALWAATVLEHLPRLESKFWQGRRALAHGQLRSEHVNKIEQGQQGSSRAEAVFCRFPSPVTREALERYSLGCAGAGILEVRFAWAWRLAAAVAK